MAVETVKLPSPEKSVRNIHGVPKKAWAEWTGHGRAIFNAMYATMKYQGIWSHPKMVKMPPNQWKTIRWNSAWAAASFASENWP